MKLVKALALCLALVGMTGAAAQAQQSTAKGTKKRAAAKPDAVATQLNELKQAIDAQQQQIRQLSDQIQSRDSQIQQLQQKLDQSQTATSQAQSKADAAAAQASEQNQTVDALKSDVADLKTNHTSTVLTLQETQKAIHDAENPLAIHYKGITITPGGYAAAETVYRTRAASADINTPFTGIPFNAADLAHVSENNFTGRQSRLSLLAEGKVANAKIGGYYEGDFLS